MEISIKLPNHLYQNVSALAQAKKKSIAEVINYAVRKAVREEAFDFEEQAKMIKQSVRVCSDEEVLALANLQTPEDERINHLFEKNRESVLTKKELDELTKAVEQNRLDDLRKAFGMVEAQKRSSTSRFVVWTACPHLLPSRSHERKARSHQTFEPGSGCGQAVHTTNREVLTKQPKCSALMYSLAKE